MQRDRLLKGRQRRGGLIFVVIIVLVLLFGARALASYVLEYQWWKELGQLSTWISMLWYSIAPSVGATIIAFAAFWIAHARGVKRGGSGLGEHPLYAKLATVGLFLVAMIVAGATIDTWTVVRYFGGRSLGAEATAWHDPVFNLPLAFYLFKLPFYSLLLRVVLAVSLLSALIYWLTARAWQLRIQSPDWAQTGIDLSDLKLSGGLESGFLRGVVVVFLLALAAKFYLDRYDFLLDEHGFMVGVDYVAEKISLPLQWLVIGASIAAAGLFWLGFRKLAAAMALVLVLQLAIPRLVSAVYVRPNEISLQKPYIQRHIEATRTAFGLNRRTQEVEFAAKPESNIDLDRNRPLLDNVRLWDWRAFHDTVTQLQPLRPYAYADTDVDRYPIDGQLRQVLLTPREMDLNQLGEAGRGWINQHFIYTHGYGLVVAEANQITSNGLPVLFVSDAPPLVRTKSLKLTRPELYYAETSHEPVFVHTQQEEFNYPSGANNKYLTYDGTGGFPISSFGMRAVAALAYGQWNIVFTGYLSEGSRMMIHRRITDRLETLAGFVHWDADPYLVLTQEGRQVWMADGYLTSDAHPYSSNVNIQGIGAVNYIRNSVKATIDAYSGETRLYIFDPADPLVEAYRTLFPALFRAASEMPADLRAHTRYPETMFRAQSEIYRTFHMRDPETFYNKADLWDIAKSATNQAGQPTWLTPTYVVATVPGGTEPEFLLILPFTPRNKDNLLGLMVARCDGEHLGELMFLQLAKQELILGPLQIEARINQDQNISKDLTLWNQQGSGVLRGQMLVLPVQDTFLYVEPIYIQASQAKMPQLKKIALAMGNILIYTDTWEQALVELKAAMRGEVPKPAAQTTESAAAAQPAVATAATAQNATVEAIRSHWRRYRELSAQGKWAEAGKELDAIDGLLKR